MPPPAPLPPPDLHIPSSSSTVDVSIINTTATLHGIDAWKFIQPEIPGHPYLAVPCFSFLIHHPTLNRKLVFDLGVRKDWWNSSPFLTARFKAGGYRLHADKDVRDILGENGVSLDTIEAVVWSHWHFDHTGDPSTFPASTALVVGPGFKEKILPGYPTNPDSPILESDYTGRELRELDFTKAPFKIGRFDALDYFGDGSLYFLDAPGHAVGHICALARVTAGSGKDSFIFMGGDACHHMGEARPSSYMPLPKTIEPHPFCPEAVAKGTVKPCPGALFEPVLVETVGTDGKKEKDWTKPIYEPARGRIPKMHYDEDEAVRTVEKMQEADADDNVLVVVAHDESMLDVVDFYPEKANSFVEKGWVERSRWSFLKDFASAVGWEGSVEGARDWSAAGAKPESKRDGF